MTTQPLMPKATAVWLVDNTSLSFDQIAQLCNLHPLEVKAIADGDAAQGIKGADPIVTGQLTRRGNRRRRSRSELPPAHRRAEGAAARGQAEKGPALYAGVAPPGPPQRHPVAGAQSSGAERQPDHAARRHHQIDHRGNPRTHPLEFGQSDAARSGDARAVLADRSRPRSPARRQGKAGPGRSPGRDAVARFGDHRAEGKSRSRRRPRK